LRPSCFDVEEGVIDMHGIGLVRADPIESIKKLARAGEPLIDINAVRKTSTPE
jgi:hypothetical protein